MADTSGGDQFDPHSYLSANQQHLLRAALSSNSNTDGNKTLQNSSINVLQQFNNASLDPSSFYIAPDQQPSGSLSTFDAFKAVEDSAYLDFADGHQNFLFDDFDPDDDQMTGFLPALSNGSDENDNIHDKRKSPGNGTTEVGNDAKRQEGDEKVAKKPGRKPLTSEPTTKRKAQNRAAQRAFRERKEQHLKDLETKVVDLQKQSESEKHENGLLRAQVERLQTELREYRRRLSSGRTSGSPTTSAYLYFLSNVANGGMINGSSNFQLDFPPFGGLPGAQIFNNGTLGNKQELTRSQLTPKVGLHSLNNFDSEIHISQKLPAPSTQPTNGTNYLNGTRRVPDAQIGRPSIDSSSAPSRVFQFNSNSTSSNTYSPSISSLSQSGANSSCCTSPEPSLNSPAKDANLDKVTEQSYVSHVNSEVPAPASALGADTIALPATLSSSVLDVNTNGIDWMATQNGGDFNPALFGDYRESTAAIVGDGDFTGGFFNDAMSMPDFGSNPFSVGVTPALQKSNPLEEIEKMQDGGDKAVVPGEGTSQMLSCPGKWDKRPQNQPQNDSFFDMDSLCSEFHAKARCTVTGAVITHKDLHEALKGMPPEKQQEILQRMSPDVAGQTK